MNKSLSLIIADPFPLSRTGIKELIRKKDIFTPPKFASCTDEAFNLVKPKKQEWIVITDDFIKQHEKDCITEIIKKDKAVKILIVTAQRNIFLLDRWRRLGVKAIIHKSTTGDELKKAVLHILAGNKIYLCPVIQKIFNDDSALLTGNKKVILSERQRVVFIGKLEGKQNKEIADENDLEPKTVGGYYRDAKAKIRRWKNGNHLDYAIAFGIISEKLF